MPAPYPLPGNVTFGGMFSYIASVDPNFFNIMLLVLWVVFFLGLNTAGLAKPGTAFTASSWAIFLLAMLLSIVGVVANTIIFITIIMVAIGFIWMLNQEP